MLRWNVALQAVGDLVFPQACPACGRTLSADEEDWCLSCLRELQAVILVDACPRCGRSAGPYLADASGCPGCRGHRSPVAGFTSVAPYAGIVGELVRKYKYARVQRLDRSLASLAANALRRQPWHAELDALVPVPATWRSRLRYGFDPAGMLAAEIGRELSLPALPMLYVRGKKRRQVDLTLSERPGNVRGVFHLHRRAYVEGTTLCVIDDVSTSGSTLKEIARLLKRAGAARVYGAAVAKTDPSGSDAARP